MIAWILSHLSAKGAAPEASPRPPYRATRRGGGCSDGRRRGEQRASGRVIEWIRAPECHSEALGGSLVWTKTRRRFCRTKRGFVLPIRRQRIARARRQAARRDAERMICCTLREDLLVEVSKPARAGRCDYLLVASTGISAPLPVAEARLGRRTVLTFPLLPPPQKN